MLAIRERLLTEGIPIGKGKEADIFLWITQTGEKNVWKM